MKMLKILGVLMLIGMVASVLLGGRNDDKNQTPQSVAAAPTVMDEDAKRQAENDSKIAEAQAEYEKRKSSVTSNESSQVVVKEYSKEMDFDSCLALQKGMENAISPNYKTLHLVSTSELSVVRFCTNDGSVLSTCSRPDKKSVTLQSTNMEGCN